MTDLQVIGLGYVGLPTAALFARGGLRVAGVDINPQIVDAVNRGESPIEEPGLPELLRGVVSTGRLRAMSLVGAAEAHLIAVGTPVGPDRRPDLRHVESAASALAGVLRRGDLVVVESTVPPGTTGRRLREVLERGSGLTAGRDFRLAHCAERAIPGSTLREMVENDRLVGGVDEESAKRAASLYSAFVRGRLETADLLTSEIVKLAENTYRDVNIAFANELSRLCEGVGADVWRVIEHANRHPRVHLHKPGPGVGGHCIPVVPWFLAAAAPSPEEARLIRAARHVNDQQALHVARSALSLASARGADRRPSVALLGVAYKPGIDDARESPALAIVQALETQGAEVRVTDPHVKRFPRRLVPLDDALRGADLAVVLNEEAAYAGLDPQAAGGLMRTRLVYDARGCLDVGRWRAAGFRVETLGRGPPA